MKKFISFLLLLIVLFIGIELLITFLTKEYVVKYNIINNYKKFEIEEKYYKKNGDTYDILIKMGDNKFLYTIINTFNKQKKIISKIEYYEDGNNICIYPVLRNNTSSYIECMDNGNIVLGDIYSNQEFINNIKNDLIEKKYIINDVEDINSKVEMPSSVLYDKNIKENDCILMWQYKGISSFCKSGYNSSVVLDFDVYENKIGTLVGKYYVVPFYTNSKVLEFNKLILINVETFKTTEIILDTPLSSSTYVNGVIDNKLYLTDADNLVQVEVNVYEKKHRIIGNVSIGGQMYENGKWVSRNIYDFKNNIKFNNVGDSLKDYSYIDVKEGNTNYYFYDNGGNFYKVSKAHPDVKVLLFRQSEFNNFNVVGNDIFYVVGNTVYSYTEQNGIVKILENNDIIYNTNNRVSIYRK